MAKYKLVSFAIGISALLVLELIAKRYYRPYVYSNKIEDFHVADTLGNSLGTLVTVFMLIFLFSTSKKRGDQLVKGGVVILVVYELAQPLLGRSIDPWDVLATLVTGAICFFIHHYLFKEVRQ